MATAASPFLDDLRPPAFHETWHKHKPAEVVKRRAADLPGMTALPVRALMPGLPDTIWSQSALLGPTSLDEVRRQAQARAQAMDWSKIEHGRTVNLLAKPHGFQLCGMAYVTMLEVIAAHVRETPGAFRVTRELGEHLLARAPEVRRQVEDVYLPKWLRQRGLA